MHFIVYGRDNCPYCVNAKQMIERKNDTYTEINLSDPILLKQFKEKYPEFKTVPQIFKEEEKIENHIGGYDKLTLFYS